MSGESTEFSFVTLGLYKIFCTILWRFMMGTADEARCSLRCNTKPNSMRLIEQSLCSQANLPTLACIISKWGGNVIRGSIRHVSHCQFHNGLRTPTVSRSRNQQISVTLPFLDCCSAAAVLHIPVELFVQDLLNRSKHLPLSQLDHWPNSPDSHLYYVLLRQSARCRAGHLVAPVLYSPVRVRLWLIERSLHGRTGSA